MNIPFRLVYCPKYNISPRLEQSPSYVRSILTATPSALLRQLPVSFYIQLQSGTECCIIYQADILYKLKEGYHFEKTTNKKTIAYRFIASVSCHVILFQPRLNHKCRVERNNQREFHSFCFNVFDVYSFREIILFLFLSGGMITGMCFCCQ